MSNQKKPLPRITLRNLRPPYDEADGDYVYFVDAADNPFRHDARGFESVNAWWLCEAATLAYSEPDTVRRIFTEKTPLRNVRDFSTGGGTQCFVASDDDFAVVAFRGTETSPRRGPRPDFREVFLDIVADVDIRASVFGEGAKVHRGFKEAVDEVWEGGGLKEYVAGLPSRTIWFTGHSLGAALATLAAARSPRLDGLYTFGSPRVGDAGFAAAFARLLSERGIEYHRFVNNNDVVTTVPLTALPPTVAFKHVGALKHIDAAGHVHDSPALFERLKDRVRGLLPVDSSGRLDASFFNLIPDGIEDHVPTLYATHIWNSYVEESNG
jgi:hypothetical protein